MALCCVAGSKLEKLGAVGEEGCMKVDRYHGVDKVRKVTVQMK